MQQLFYVKRRNFVSKKIGPRYCRLRQNFLASAEDIFFVSIICNSVRRTGKAKFFFVFHYPTDLLQTTNRLEASSVMLKLVLDTRN